MKNILLNLILLFACGNSLAQLTAEQKAIVEEGKRMYRSEMASWYGTDILTEQFPGKTDDLGGYFSYLDGDNAICVFYSKSNNSRAILTVTFDKTYNMKPALIDSSERVLNVHETLLKDLRIAAQEIMISDTIFQLYEHTNFNLVLEEGEKENKVYVLTGPQENGVVIFGNDYLIVFDKANKFIGRKKIHQNIIAINSMIDKKDSFGAVHNHLPETGDMITATDICTLMLYEKFTNWKSHVVVTEHNICIWTCATNSLIITPSRAFENTNKK